MDGSIIVVRNFNMPLSALNRFTRQDMSKDTRYLNEELEELGLIDL